MSEPLPGGMKHPTTMQLEVLLPTEVLVDEPVTKVIAEAENGSFCLLPRHIDFVAALSHGLLTFTNASGEACYAAIDEGVLVKCGSKVSVSTLNGVRSDDLSKLRTLLDRRSLELDEHERRARTALARLEAGALRSFFEMQEQLHG